MNKFLLRLVVAVSLMEDAQFTGADSSIILFHTAAGSLLSLEPDDIIVSAYRHGLLRRVTAVDTVANQIQISTEQGALTDVFSSVSISLDMTPTLADLDSVSDHFRGIAPKLSDDMQSYAGRLFSGRFRIASSFRYEETVNHQFSC